MKLSKIVYFGFTLTTLSGCASFTRTPIEDLVLDTSPGKAEVALSNGRVCTTPCSIEMWRKHGVVATITRPGYQTRNVTIVADMNFKGGMTLIGGNAVICCGVPGMAVDIMLGSHQTLSPNPVVVDLVPLGENETPEEAIVKPGESFRFKPYIKTGVKEPLKSRERAVALLTTDQHLPENDTDPDDERACSIVACMNKD